MDQNDSQLASSSSSSSEFLFNETSAMVTTTTTQRPAHLLMRECYFDRMYAGNNEFYYNYKLAVVGVLLPLIGAFGLFANTLVLFVYSRPMMRTVAVNMYLAALACSDICTICSSIYLFTLDVYRYQHPSVANIYGRFIQYVYPLGTTFQTISIYITVSACVQCYLCVRYTVTNRVVRMMSPKSLIPLVVAFGVIYNFVRFFEVKMVPCWEAAWNQTSVDVTAMPMRYNRNYDLLYYSIGYTVLMCMAPLLILIYLSGYIVYQTYFGRASHHFAEDPEAKGDTINLVMVVVMFIVCNSLSVTVNFLELLLHRRNPMIRYMIDLSNLLVTFNSSVNFLIYHRFSIKFRRVLRELLATIRSTVRHCEWRSSKKYSNRFGTGQSEPLNSNHHNLVIHNAAVTNGSTKWSYKQVRNSLTTSRRLSDGESGFVHQMNPLPYSPTYNLQHDHPQQHRSQTSMTLYFCDNCSLFNGTCTAGTNLSSLKHQLAGGHLQYPRRMQTTSLSQIDKSQQNCNGGLNDRGHRCPSCDLHPKDTHPSSNNRSFDVWVQRSGLRNGSLGSSAPRRHHNPPAVVFNSPMGMHYLRKAQSFNWQLICETEECML